MHFLNHLKHSIKTLLYELKHIKSINYKKSYSQCGEDLIIKFIFDSLSITNPSYIDIGAHHPFIINNTALFYQNGSRGINIDPDPTLLDEFNKERTEDKNINVGVGIKKTSMELFIMNEKALNTFSKEDADNCVKEGLKIMDKKLVEILTIDEILKTYNDGKFPDILSLDAEGFDEAIIKSIDFKKNYPKVICVETITFSKSGKGVKKKDLIDYIINNGYLLYADTYINSLFIREDIWVNQ